VNKRSLIVWNIRLPRVFVAALVGMNLAVGDGRTVESGTHEELMNEEGDPVERAGR
jgi:iron complex transport system permease protein